MKIARHQIFEKKKNILLYFWYWLLLLLSLPLWEVYRDGRWKEMLSGE